MEISTHIFIQQASQRLLRQAAYLSTQRKALKPRHLANSQLAYQAQWGAAFSGRPYAPELLQAQVVEHNAVPDRII